jgi:hypothetical protein
MSRVYPSCSIHATPCTDGAELEETVESWTILADQDCKTCGQRDGILAIGLVKGGLHRVPFPVKSSAVSGDTLCRKSMYSSVWKRVISTGEERLARCRVE